MKKSKFLFIALFVICAAIGILQFFPLPRTLNYILGAVALLCGVAGLLLLEKE